MPPLILIACTVSCFLIHVVVVVLENITGNFTDILLTWENETLSDERRFLYSFLFHYFHFRTQKESASNLRVNSKGRSIGANGAQLFCNVI